MNNLNTPLLNNNNIQATIKLSEVNNFRYDGTKNDDVKTWDQLNDSEKQDIASSWIKDHIYCNVNQVMELLSQNDDHCDYDSYQEIAEGQDFEGASTDHINDLNIDEMIELIEEYDLDIDVDQFMTDYKNVLIKEVNERPISKSDLLITLEDITLQDESTNYEVEDIPSTISSHIYNENLTNDDLETIFVNLGLSVVPFDGIEKEHKDTLQDMITDKLDLDQYGQDNNLEPEYDQAYEFYSVSDHFVSMLQDSEHCSNDILGLSVWARYCTGQSIVLDHCIQLAAFKVLSDCSYTNY